MMRGPARRRLWRLLSSRGGWDRVRASLLATTETDPSVAGQGRADLGAWLLHGAVRMWQPPSPDQRDDIALYLSQAAIPYDVRAKIEFLAGLPVTPRPRPQWTQADAAVLLALAGTGGPFQRPRTLRGVLHRVAASGSEPRSHGTFVVSVGRLVGSDLLHKPVHDSYALTVAGRRLLKLVGDLEEGAGQVLAVLQQVPIDEDNWWLSPDEYARAAEPLRP